MALTFGFYNSLTGDRKYDAIQMASIFDGIIEDGVLMSIGDYFRVTATGGMGVTVGTGRAWFHHTWTYNSSAMRLNVPNSEQILNRVDALVLEVDARDESRTNSIKFVTGAPSSVPVRPILKKENYINQYPLAYIYIAQGTTEILQSNITNMIGTSETPFVTSPLKTINADALLVQWQTQWESVLASLNTQKTQQQSSWQTQTSIQQSEFESMKAIWGNWIGGAIADPANYFQRNFDNPAMYVGSTLWRTKVDSLTTLEEIRSGTLQTGSLAARRVTARRTNGADIDYIFYNLQNGTMISRFVEHFDRVSSNVTKNWVQGVM